MNVFISYRREDTGPYAGRLYDRLRERFGAEHVFIDIDSIPLGDDFVNAIADKIAVCDVMIVLIGRRWLDSRDPAGQRMVDRVDDFVRLEIATALSRCIRLVPVLIGETVMPSASELPDVISPLARRQALPISDFHFHQDVDRLIKAIAVTKLVHDQQLLKRHGRWRKWATVIIGAALVVTACVVLSFSHFLSPQLDHGGSGAELWIGVWAYNCDTKLGVVRGQLRIKSDKPPSVTGTYTDTAVRGELVGRIEGTHQELLSGTWKNQGGQEGKLIFKLNSDGASFLGNYSMSPNAEPSQEKNHWNGSRLSTETMQETPDGKVSTEDNKPNDVSLPPCKPHYQLHVELVEKTDLGERWMDVSSIPNRTFKRDDSRYGHLGSGELRGRIVASGCPANATGHGLSLHWILDDFPAIEMSAQPDRFGTAIVPYRDVIRRGTYRAELRLERNLVQEVTFRLE
jgi:hypothetical protein